MPTVKLNLELTVPNDAMVRLTVPLICDEIVAAHPPAVPETSPIERIQSKADYIFSGEAKGSCATIAQLV